METKEYILTEYIPALDALGPQFKTTKYPALVFFIGEHYIIYDYPKLELLFRNLTALMAITQKG